MAKVGGPLHSSIAVGQIGKALIYNNWRGIAYVKAYKGPANPATARQLTIRGYLAQLSQLWQGLSDANRTSWQGWADANQPNDEQFNRPIPWSGFNAYTALNILMLDMGESIVDSAPVVVGPGPVVGLDVTLPVADIVIDWTATAGTNYSFDLWSFLHPSPVRNPNIPLFRHYVYATGESGSMSIVGPAVGTWYFIARIVSEDDGQSSTFVRGQVTVS